MGDTSIASQVSSVSIRFCAVFTVLGLSLLYLYIGIADVPETVKILWASGLSIVLAVVFLIVWTLAKDMGRQERSGTP